MLILDIPRKTAKHAAYVDIPVYHRTHLGLSQDSTVHYCLLPGYPSKHGSHPHIPLPELVISPFDFQKWSSLYRLTVSLRDRVGLFHEISDTLQRFGVNIEAAESGMMEEQNMYHIEMIVHVMDENQLRLIEWSLLARLVDDIVFLPDGNPRLRIRRVFNLSQAKSTYERLSTLSDSKEKPNVPFRPYVDKAKVEPLTSQPDKPRSLRLRLPPTVRDIIRKFVGDSVDDGFHLRISDTKDRFLRVLFFKSSDSVVHARIEHDDRVGVLAAITDALKKDNFSVLTALSTPSENKGRSIFEVVVRALDFSHAESSLVKSKLESALMSSLVVDDFNLKIGYPTGYVSTWVKIPIKSDNLHAQDNSPDEIDLYPTLLENLNVLQQALAQSLQRGTLLEYDRNKFILSTKLLDQYSKLTSTTYSKPLFVSCHYAGAQLDVIKKIAPTMGFIVVTGENLLKFKDQIQGLVKKISTCTHFLGVWSAMGAQQFGDKYWPSPWLHWELGVAEALGLKWGLLISKLITKESWAKIHLSPQHVLFDEATFETQLREALDALASEVFPEKS